MSLALMFFSGMMANLGMQVVKNENAVFKQSMMLLPIPILWIYHIYYGNKEKFSVIKLLAQTCLVTFILLFMTWDRQ